MFAVLLRDKADENLVKIRTAEVTGAFTEENIDPVTVDIEDRDVEGSSAQIIDENFAPNGLGVGIEESCGGWLVHDPANPQSREPSGRYSRLASQFVEVCRNGDDHFFNLADDFCALLPQL